MLLPVPLLLSIMTGLASLALLAVGIYCLWRAVRILRSRRDERLVVEPGVRIVRTRNRPLALLLFAGIVLPIFSLGGRQLVEQAFPVGSDEPKQVRSGRVQYVKGAGGANLRVETYGDPNAPALVFTHGWSMNSTEWYYAKRDLSSRFQLIVWDLPGLGESSEPSDRDWGLETMARDLGAVVATTNGKRVVLVGHSIGGMINLTFCRVFPELLGSKVVGIAQVDTTYTNPVKTMKNSSLNMALQKPVAEPILYAMIAASPLLRVMNWMSYANGTSVLMNAKTSFAGSETRGQVDLVSRLQAEASPAVVARGTLAMFHWDATPVVPRVNVPMLLVVGAEDTTTLPRASEYMKENAPHAKLVVVSPGAHYSLLELNQEVDAAIRDFASAQLGSVQATASR